MTVVPPYWVEVLTKGGREIIWTTLPDKQVGYFCLPGLIPVGRYIPITPDIYFDIRQQWRVGEAVPLKGWLTGSNIMLGSELSVTSFSATP